MPIANLTLLSGQSSARILPVPITSPVRPKTEDQRPKTKERKPRPTYLGSSISVSFVAAAMAASVKGRSEERRVGKEYCCQLAHELSQCKWTDSSHT